MSENAVLEQPQEKKPETTEPTVEEITAYLRESVFVPEGLKLVIKPLWANKFRLNFWCMEVDPVIHGPCIRNSKFVSVSENPEGKLAMTDETVTDKVRGKRLANLL